LAPSALGVAFVLVQALVVAGFAVTQAVALSRASSGAGQAGTATVPAVD
jgi:hypothetical protein